MLVEAKSFATEEKAKTFAFEEGLDEAESDICMGSNQPDMGPSFLKGKEITIKLPDKPEYLQRLEFIRQGFNVTLTRAASIAFLQGLLNLWLILKDSRLYQEDTHFRKMVNEMPHDVCYDVMDPVFEEEYTQE